MIFLLDNYDSFTYNLYQYLCELGAEIEVARNDQITPAEIAAKQPAGIVVSPGPCSPKEAGISVQLIQELAGTVPILGVCLGHQSIGEAFGGRIVNAGEIVHGKLSDIHHDAKGVFAGLPNPFPAIRYHSLIIEEASIPDCLEITARTDRGLIMGVRHKTLPVEGVQFHPESILTKPGKDLLQNFLTQCREPVRVPAYI